MGQLDGKTALITGGSSGIGLATAARFAAEGARVTITGRRERELTEAVAQIGPNATGVRGDASDPADLDRLFAGIADLDIVFANAGGGEFGTLDRFHLGHRRLAELRGLRRGQGRHPLLRPHLGRGAGRPRWPRRRAVS